MALVFADADCVLMFNGRRVNLSQDDAWEADDEFVKARPDLFRPRPRNVFGHAGRTVETAAVDPGGRRRRG